MEYSEVLEAIDNECELVDALFYSEEIEINHGNDAELEGGLEHV